MSQQVVSADINPNSALLFGSPPARAAQVQHMIQLYSATTVQTGFYLPLYAVLFYFFGQVMKELYGNIFNKPAV